MINSSIVSKDAVNKFKEMFPLARMIPLAVMHTPFLAKIFVPPTLSPQVTQCLESLTAPLPPPPLIRGGVTTMTNFLIKISSKVFSSSS